MAVPSRHRHKSEGRRDHGSMRLEYAGKLPIRDILALPAGQYTTSENHKGNPNRLYHDDNLPVLCSLYREEGIRGHVRLVYIDPPFATEASFESRTRRHAYDDHLAGAGYVEALRHRLVLIRELLSNDGALYLHLDARMVFHMRLVLDEVFGEANFRGFITRRKCNPKNYTRKTYGNVSDYILFYTKGDSYVWNRPTEEWDDARIAKEYPSVDGHGRRYKKVPVHAPGVRNGQTGRAWRGVMPPLGKHWQYTPAKLDEMDARGEIYWSQSGNPRRKVFLDQSAGVPVQDIWTDLPDAQNQNSRITGYPTEKNPELLKRIVEASSNRGDIVMDCYAGSGTTLEVASVLQRRWIGVDRSDEAIQVVLNRFENGTEPMGDFVNRRRQSSLPIHKRIEDFSLLTGVSMGERYCS